MSDPKDSEKIEPLKSYIKKEMQEKWEPMKYLSPVEVIKGTKRQTQIFETDNPPGRKKGGPVKKGVKYIVGEKGPEVFVPKKSGTIVPNRTAPKPQKKETRGLAAFAKEMKQEN
jgi:hypothetical protein